MSRFWVEVSISYNKKAFPYLDLEDIISSKLWDINSSGVAIDSSSSIVRITGYFPFDALLYKRLEELKLSLGEYILSGLKFSFNISEESEWQKFGNFEPFQIGRFFVIPSEINYDTPNGLIPIFIKPGMAFGTGLHPTTRMCIKLLETIPLEGKIGIDVGTGSGILAICMLKLGCFRVIGIDNDLVAISDARENALKSGVLDNLELRLGDLLNDYNEGGVDVIVGNLLPQLMIPLFRKIPSTLNIGGHLIVSGFSENESKDIEELALSYSLSLKEKLEEEGWSALLFTYDAP
ncbi:MAG: 50S ribosomal protein L11 methyltransferase [bacterium]|nr:50S ribosomal protein L11 methyltransferase [bacterium]